MPELTLAEKVNEQLTDADAKINIDIQKAQKDFDDGKILKGGPGCITYFRLLRNKALGYYQPIKQEIYQCILNGLTHENNTHGLNSLQTLSEEINAQEAKKQKTNQDKARKKSELKLSIYDKFVLYGDLNTTRKSQTNDYRNDPVRSVVFQAQKDYEAKKRSDTMWGIAFSLIFAGMDFNIIYNVFLSSNMALSGALVSAFLSAVMLDIPPYVLGNLVQRWNDRKRFWLLRGKHTGKSAEVDLKPYVIGSRLLVAAIVLFFLMYLALRVILFFGGGDFDLALHFLLNREFNFAAVEFNSSDFISMLFPIVTSAVAFVVGLMKYTPYVEHIEKTVKNIDKALNAQIDDYSSAIVEYDKEKSNLALRLDREKQQIWAFYFKAKPLPKNDEEFIEKVSTAFQQLALTQCTEDYRIQCTKLRESAEGSLKHINTELAPYVTAPMEISTMALSFEEQATLDSFWVTGEGCVQVEETKRHIKNIENTIRKLVQPKAEQKTTSKTTSKARPKTKSKQSR